MDDAPRRNRYLAAAVCGLLLLMVAIVFGRTVQYDFVNFDDDAYVYDNPHVAHGLGGEGIAWSFTTLHSCNWHPLTWLSHALDCELYGTQNAAGHHATNVVLHAAVAILLFLVLWQMTGSLWPSAFVAAVFAVHPLRVESVAWVSERKDLLSGLFFMLTLGAYLRYVRHPFSWARYLLVIAMFALGLMAKPMLVTLPFVLLLLDYWPLWRFTNCLDKPLAASHATPVSRLIVEKIPLLMLAGGSCMVTSAAQHNALVPVDVVPVSSRMANALVSYVAYIGQFFYPAGLAVFYPHPQDGLPTWKIAVAAAVLVGIPVAALLAWRRLPYLFVGWFWYVGMLVPVIGVVQVGSQAMADRYTYLPQIGLCIAIVWGAAAVGQKFLFAGKNAMYHCFAEAVPGGTSDSDTASAKQWHTAARNAGYRRLVYVVASTLVLAGLMACAWRQTSYWQNSETLWTRAAACMPANASLHDRLGSSLATVHKLNAAVAEYRKAIAIDPACASAHNGLGKALAEQGRIAAAIAECQKAIRLKPDYADAHNNLGVILADQRADGRRGRPISRGAANQARLRTGPQQSRQDPGQTRPQRRSDPRIPLCDRVGSRWRRSPQRSRRHPGQVRAARRRDCRVSQDARRSSRIWRRSTAILPWRSASKERSATRRAHWREVVRLQPDNLRAVNQLAWTMATAPEASLRNGGRPPNWPNGP